MPKNKPMPKKKRTEEERSAIEQEHDESPSNVPEDEQGIEQEKEGEERKEKEQLDMEIGEKEEEPYDEEGREKLVEDDDIEPREEAFAEGYEARGRLSKCANCSKLLDEDNTMEREFDGGLVWFCSSKCVSSYAKNKKKKLG